MGTLRISYGRGKLNSVSNFFGSAKSGPNVLDLMIIKPVFPTLNHWKPFQDTAARKYDREWEQFLQDNLYCADCDDDIKNSPQVFFSSEFGVFLCLDCSGHHRDNQDLVTAVQLDDDCPEKWRRLKKVRVVGNHDVNQTISRSVALKKPRSTSDTKDKLAYIRAKYFERRSDVVAALAAAMVKPRPKRQKKEGQQEQRRCTGEEVQQEKRKEYRDLVLVKGTR